MVTEVASSNETQTVVQTGDREAIIFIPGIGKNWDDPSIEGVARRIAVAIDRQAKTEKAKTHVEVAEQEYGSAFKYKCKKFTVVKSIGNTAQPLIDVFGLDYNDTLVESYAKRPLFIRIFLLAFTLIDSFLRLIFRFYKRSKSVKEKLQLIYGLMMAALLVVYFVILIGAVVTSIEQLRNLNSQTDKGNQTAVTAPPTGQNALAVNRVLQAQSSFGIVFQDAGGKDRGFFGTVRGAIKGAWYYVKAKRSLFPSIIVLMTALGFVLPPKAQVREKISLAATNYLCLIHYINWGERSHVIGGKLEALIEYLVEGEKAYSRIHIIGYSFGSIVALDNIFTLSRRPIERFAKVNTLVTIGCPFDIIRTYWPDYFKGRHSAQYPEPNMPKWINVYSPIDVLSSNFADSGNDQSLNKDQQPNVGVEVEGQTHSPKSIMFVEGAYQGLGIIDILTLAGFRAHALYWGEEVRGEITCFHEIVREMYGELYPESAILS